METIDRANPNKFPLIALFSSIYEVDLNMKESSIDLLVQDSLKRNSLLMGKAYPYVDFLKKKIVYVLPARRAGDNCLLDNYARDCLIDMADSLTYLNLHKVFLCFKEKKEAKAMLPTIKEVITLTRDTIEFVIINEVVYD